MTDYADEIARLPALDGVLEHLDGLDPAFLVGGAVRDLLRGRRAVDADLAIEGDAIAAAQVLASRMDGRATLHERFGTATVDLPDGRSVDFAGTRREAYVAPGALPRVSPASLDEDLARRDFTVNAMAISLAHSDVGRLEDPFDGLEDVEEGAIRILHGRSFFDDPTRLLRACRYSGRLEWPLESETDALARAAVAERALDTVSTVRLGNELRKIAAEPTAPAATAVMVAVGLGGALHPGAAPDGEVVALAREAAGEVGADSELTGLAALVLGTPPEFVADLGLRAGERERVAEAIAIAPGAAADPDPERALAALLAAGPETLALASALGADEQLLRAARSAAAVELDIAGDDLVAAGVPQSPAIGRALTETLRRKRAGDVQGREEELELALRVARGQR